MDDYDDSAPYDLEYEAKEKSNDEFYARTKKIVMVPVEVSYYENFEMVFDFKAPTEEEVGKALKESLHISLDQIAAQERENIRKNRQTEFIGYSCSKCGGGHMGRHCIGED